MIEARTEDVQRLYERYPYPYSVGNTEPDLLLTYPLRSYFGLSSLAGWRILDAGCGTGHKLMGLAVTYPKAHFVGLELSAASVAVARGLITQHQLTNVEVQQGNMLEGIPAAPYDFVQAFGVVHHLENPQQGLQNLCQAVKEEGMVAIWLYHPLGEFERLTQRELLLTLWGGDWQDMAQGQTLMEQLGLHLLPTHYGPRDQEANALEGDADAFMHPIVRAYTMAEALAMLRLAGMEWAAVDFINLSGTVKMVNLANIHDPYVGSYCIRGSELFTAPALAERYESLTPGERLRVIELTLRPRGFQMLAGRGQSDRRLGQRMRGNVLRL